MPDIDTRALERELKWDPRSYSSCLVRRAAAALATWSEAHPAFSGQRDQLYHFAPNLRNRYSSALGAQMAVLRRMLMGRVLALVWVGLALGLAGAALLARVMESLVFGVTPHDPVTYAQVSAILGLTAICAGYLPARRITRIDPVLALRAE